MELTPVQHDALEELKRTYPATAHAIWELASMTADLAQRVEELEKAVDFAHAEIQKPHLKIVEGKSSD